MAAVLEATALARRFGGRRADGLLLPSSGSARIAGVTLPGCADARALVGIISRHSMLYGALSAREN